MDKYVVNHAMTYREDKEVGQMEKQFFRKPPRTLSSCDRGDSLEDEFNGYLPVVKDTRVCSLVFTANASMKHPKCI